MAKKAKHAFGNLADVQNALNSGKIDAYDILFLDGDTEPKIGWIDAKGVFRLVENESDFSELEDAIATKANASDVEALETALKTKANTEEVDAKIAAAMDEHLTKKYEVTDVPDGTLVDYGEKEIRIMCKDDAVWVKQAVGEGGDANTYYCTFKTYAPIDAAGYIEHLGNKVDEEILTDLKTDEHGRKYQPSWLGLAKYDEESGTWTYYGASSTSSKMIGWDYRIDFYDASGVMIASDCIRINLSNEDCHYAIEPYYVNNVKSYVDTQIEEKISEVNSAYEVVEF